MKQWIFNQLETIAQQGHYHIRHQRVTFVNRFGPFKIVSDTRGIYTEASVYFLGCKMFYVDRDLLLGQVVVIPPLHRLRQRIRGLR
jgi:hypothetical protein